MNGERPTLCDIVSRTMGRSDSIPSPNPARDVLACDAPGLPPVGDDGPVEFLGSVTWDREERRKAQQRMDETRVFRLEETKRLLWIRDYPDNEDIKGLPDDTLPRLRAALVEADGRREEALRVEHELKQKLEMAGAVLEAVNTQRQRLTQAIEALFPNAGGAE